MIGDIFRHGRVKARRFVFLAFAAIGALAIGACGEEVVPSVIFQSDRDGNWEIYSVFIDGTMPTNLTNNPAADTYPALSLEGEVLAFIRSTESGNDIWTADPDGANATNLTNGSATGEIHSIAWYPRGSALLFTMTVDGVAEGRSQMYKINADGSSMAKLDADEDFYYRNAQVSPVGGRIAAGAGTALDSLGIHLMEIDGSLLNILPSEGDFRTIIEGSFWVDGVSEDEPDFDTTGRRILYTSDIRGSFSLYEVESDGRKNSPSIELESNDRHPYRSSELEAFGLAFTSDRDGNDEIYLLNQVNSELTRLTNNPAQDMRPTWIKEPAN
jgi:Tol biopolymer transport system component